jgi:hypothetical protein
MVEAAENAAYNFGFSMASEDHDAEAVSGPTVEAEANRTTARASLLSAIRELQKRVAELEGRT